MSIRPHFIFVMLASLLMLSAPALAQQRAISASVEVNSRVYVGDVAEFRIVVRNSNVIAPPDLSTIVPGLTFALQGTQDLSSSMTTIINGQVTQRSTLGAAAVYTLTPSKSGEFTIPSIPVSVGAIQYQTAPVRITVVEPERAADFALSLQVERTVAYVGQPIPISLRWKLARNVNSPSITLPISGLDIDLKPGPAAQAALSGQVAHNMTGMRVNGEQDVVAIDDSTVTLDKVIIPKRAGTITIGSPRIDFLAASGTRARPFDHPMMDRNTYERAFSSTDGLTITVLDLPSAGKPADFSGLVGKYSIFASADATSVSVGDPINLTIGINGPHPLSLVPALDLSRQLANAKSFRVRREPVLPLANQAQAIFRAAIRPRSADVKEIGPISLNYFDPDLKQYLTTQSKPVPLTVQASTSVELPELDEPESSSLPTPSIPRPGGLPDLSRDPVTAAVTPDREGDALLLAALIVVPPAVFIMIVVARLALGLRSRNPVSARRRKAIRRLNKDLRRSTMGHSDADAVSSALSTFAAGWFDLPAHAVTARQAADLFSKSRTQASETVAAILRDCDRLRFGSSADQLAPPADLRARARDAATQLVRELHDAANATSAVPVPEGLAA